MRYSLFWLDLEMTGLNPEKNVMLQCAAIVTKDNLEIVSDGVEYTIHQSAQDLQNMDPVVLKIHTESGLLDQVMHSHHTIEQVEELLVQFFHTQCVPKKTLLCGNSIWVDRSFLKKYMPAFESLFYYRMIDVSTFKELSTRWYPEMAKFKKNKKHTALADIQESIAELQYYRETLFLP